jgi:hypothetical protein
MRAAANENQCRRGILMSTHALISRGVRFALACGAASAVVATTVRTQEETIQEIVVTGSRIPQPNLTSISPVQSVGADQTKLNNALQAVVDPATGRRTRSSARATTWTSRVRTRSSTTTRCVWG